MKRFVHTQLELFDDEDATDITDPTLISEFFASGYEPVQRFFARQAAQHREREQKDAFTLELYQWSETIAFAIGEWLNERERLFVNNLFEIPIGQPVRVNGDIVVDIRFLLAIAYHGLTNALERLLDGAQTGDKSTRRKLLADVLKPTPLVPPTAKASTAERFSRHLCNALAHYLDADGIVHAVSGALVRALLWRLHFKLLEDTYDMPENVYEESESFQRMYVIIDDLFAEYELQRDMPAGNSGSFRRIMDDLFQNAR